MVGGTNCLHEQAMTQYNDRRLTHVYIASLSHSGSTILGIALGAVPGGVCTGELDATIRRIEGVQHLCTCGAQATDCAVWGPVFSQVGEITKAPDRSTRYAAGYRALYRSIQDRPYTDSGRSTSDFASDGTASHQLLVDTSKDPIALKAIPSEPGVELKVIFLVKDPRSYFVSHYRKWLASRRSAGSNRPKRGEKRRDKRRAPTFLVELAVAIVNWWWGNRRFLRMLRWGGYDYSVVSYEELVLDTARVEARLSEFLHTEVNLGKILHRPEQRHILRGNALRHSPGLSAQLRYDFRWFYDPWVRRLGFVFLPLLTWGVRNGLLPTSTERRR